MVQRNINISVSYRGSYIHTLATSQWQLINQDYLWLLLHLRITKDADLAIYYIYMTNFLLYLLLMGMHVAINWTWITKEGLKRVMVLCYTFTLTHLVHMKGCTCQVLGILLEGLLPPAGRKKPVLHRGWQSPSDKTNSKNLLEPIYILFTFIHLYHHAISCLWESSNLNCKYTCASNYFQSYHESLAVCDISSPDWVERFLSSIGIFILHHRTASLTVYSKTYHLGRGEGEREEKEAEGETEREENHKRSI